MRIFFSLFGVHISWLIHVGNGDKNVRLGSKKLFPISVQSFRLHCDIRIYIRSRMVSLQNRFIRFFSIKSFKIAKDI